MNATLPVYSINKISDILRIAPEHRAEFFRDFASVMAPLFEISDRAHALGLSDAMNHAAIKELSIEFTPDGKQDIEIRIEGAQSDEAEA